MYTVVIAGGDSMQPTYSSTYYYILIVKDSNIYNINDIVAYKDDTDTKKVHRIVGKCDTVDRDYYIVKPDTDIGYYNYISKSDIDGTVVLSVPIPVFIPLL